MQSVFLKYILVASLFFLCLPGVLYAGTLSCSVATTCIGGTVVYKMFSNANSHAELPGQSNYTKLVCCTGVVGLGTSCSGTFATVLKLSTTTNAHAEQNSQSNYANSACLSVPTGGSISLGYQATNCSGFDTTIGSIVGTTNSHVGDGSAYTTKICATASNAIQTLTFNISANAVSFGTLDSLVARYATTTSGSASEVEAHSLSASTNASTGYVVTVRGATLAAGANTITAIGGTNTASSVGNEQFGLRMVATGGSGGVSAPYAAAGFAYGATVILPSQVAAAVIGDGVTTTYSVRYLANIGGATEGGTYATALTYIATGNF